MKTLTNDSGTGGGEHERENPREDVKFRLDKVLKSLKMLDMNYL